ncbi:MAG: S-layer homology domain-containing protein [Thermoanaerobaculia bacterium]
MRLLPPRVGPVVLWLAFSAGVLAQAPAPQSGYGDDLQVAVVPFNRFELIGDGDVAGSCCQQGLPGERWPLGSNGGILVADIDPGAVPNGADLEQISFYVRDDDSGANLNFSGRLCRTWVDAIDGANIDGDCPFLVSTFGAPGQTVIGGDPDLQVRYQYDVDGDGVEEAVSYILWAAFPDVPAGDIRLHAARLLYRRQVSPAPAVATFSDVPTSHPFFQYIEALSASGITAGCGTGIYCPDSPLTRGQMAVFLAKALGLHWPWPGNP